MFLTIKMDLALNDLHRLICHETQQIKSKISSSGCPDFYSAYIATNSNTPFLFSSRYLNIFIYIFLIRVFNYFVKIFKVTRLKRQGKH